MLARFEPLLLLILAAACTTPEPDPRVGEIAGGGHVLATEQVVRPAGETTVIDGRPLDLALGLQTLFVKEQGSVLAFDTRTGEITSRLALKDGCSMHGLAVRGGHVYATGTNNALFELSSVPPGDLRVLRTIERCRAQALPVRHRAHPRRQPCAGVPRAREHAGPRRSRLGRDAGADPGRRRTLRRVVAPDGRGAFVSNLGGRHPRAGEPSATPPARRSSSTRTRHRHERHRDARRPAGARGERRARVRPASDGARALLRRRAALRRRDELRRGAGRGHAPLRDRRAHRRRPDPLGFGSLPNALALSPDGRTLYVANGGNNAVAAVRLAHGPGSTSRVAGFVPTGWFPGAVVDDGELLCVANVKGAGARQLDAKQQAYKSTRDRGSISCALPDEAELARMTHARARCARTRHARRDPPVRARASPRRSGTSCT